MDMNTGRPNNIEDALCSMHTGQWFGWNNKEKVYANLIILDDTKTKPTEEELNAKLTEMQTDFDNAKTKKETDEASGKTKLKNLGLSDDEIKALTGK